MSFLHTLFSDTSHVTGEVASDEERVRAELQELSASFAEKQRILSRLLDGESVFLHLHRLEATLAREIELIEDERVREQEILDDLKFLSRDAYVKRLDSLRARVGTAITRDAYLRTVMNELRDTIAAQARKVHRLARGNGDAGVTQSLIDLLLIERDIVARLSFDDDISRETLMGIRRGSTMRRIRDRFAKQLLTHFGAVALDADGTAYSTSESYLSELCARIFNHLEEGISQAIETGVIAGHDQADLEYVASPYFDEFVREQVRDDAAAGKAVPSERTISAFIKTYRERYLAQARSESA